MNSSLSAQPVEHAASEEAAFCASHPKLPARLTAEMSRLFRAGFSLIPLGGPDGKRPTVSFKDKSRLPLATVINRMAAGGSCTYGIRLDGLLVVDIDTDTAEAQAYAEGRFGISSCVTKTSRGVHQFYRHAGRKPSNVRTGSIAIDFKSGRNDYVVGPYSQRPDGFVYFPVSPLVRVEELRPFVDRFQSNDEPPTTSRSPSRWAEIGNRHNFLSKQAAQLALHVEDFQELLGNLTALREWECEQPDTIPNSEIENLARWAWDKREAGELWSRRNSAVQIPRSAIDILACSTSHSRGLAMLLYNVLVSMHGHIPERTFAVVPDALRANRRLVAGRRQIYDAIDLLVESGLLVCRSKPRGSRNYCLYQLGRGLHGITEKESILILVSHEDTTPKRQQ